MRVSESLSSAFTVPPVTVTAKFVAFKLPREFSVKFWLVVEPVVVPLLVLVPDVALVVLVVELAVGVSPKLCGSVMPRFRSLSRLTSSTATSTITSARVRSRSLISFSARTS